MPISPYNVYLLRQITLMAMRRQIRSSTELIMLLECLIMDLQIEAEFERLQQEIDRSKR